MLLSCDKQSAVLVEVLIIANMKKNVIDYFKSTPKPRLKKELLLIIAVASIFLPFAATFAVMLALGAVVLTNRECRASLVKLKGAPILAAFAALSLIVPAFYQRWISVLAGVMIVVIILFMMYAQTVITSSLYDISLDICCIMSVCPFVISIIQKLVNGFGYRATGALLNANYYGMIIEFVIIISVYRMFLNPKAGKWYLAVIVINIAGLFMCDCQSAWLAIIAGILVLLYVNGYKRYAIIFLIVSAVLVMVGILVPGVLPRWDKMPQTLATRIAIWSDAMKWISKHPIFGQGTLTYLFNQRIFGGYKTYHAHSLYLEPILSYGIVGTGLLISYFVVLIKQMKTNVYIAMSQSKSRVKSLILAIMVSVCVHGITDIPLIWIQTGAFLAFIMSGAFISPKHEYA